MKVVYCSNCGTRLNVVRKALPRYGTVINIVEHHVCHDEPIELDLSPVDIPMFNAGGKNEFVQSLNDLNPSTKTQPLTEPTDRRDKADIKTTAPESVLGMIQSMENSTPDKELADIESEG